ncbi:MAG: PQQ-dependent dehydrogenase, methanol/ethanol family [Myxococcota bacterium]
MGPSSAAAAAEAGEAAAGDFPGVRGGTAVTDLRLRAADGPSDGSAERAEASEAGNWLAHGRGYAEKRYSPLAQINNDNVDALGLAWSFEIGNRVAVQTTPLAIDGVLYFTSGWSEVHALDAKTGESLWRFDPEVPRETSYRYCCGFSNRGVAAYGDRLFLGTLDGRLIALDRGTGEPVWTQKTVPEGKSYSIQGAPRIAKGKVIMGFGGAEFTGTRGYVSAYDAETGELAWRFYTVPGNPDEGFETEQMRQAAETWTGEWWKLGGGGTVWDSMAYDPELDLLYIGVGNGSPHNRRIRSPEGGDNLFLCSIIALRPETGEYVWHHQQVPAETWDYTSTQHMILAEIEWEGAPRSVIMQAPKHGFFYILDRATGELLSAEIYARKLTWASHYDLETGRPVELPGQDFAEGMAMVYPSGLGAHNWHPMSYSPRTGLVYIPALENGAPMKDEPVFRGSDRHFSTGNDMDGAIHNAQLTQTMVRALMKGYLLAWDPEKQESVWEVDHPRMGNSGTLATGGDLVFQGLVEGGFLAFDARDGTERFRFPTQNGIIGSPISFAVEGEQYIAVVAARGAGFSVVQGREFPRDEDPASARMLVFRLGGDAELPAPVARVIPPAPPMPEVTKEQLAQGSRLYSELCTRCHGSGGVSDGSIADLRHLSADTRSRFDDIVLRGAYEPIGMPRFEMDLDEKQASFVHAYLIEQAHEDERRRMGNPLWRGIKQGVYSALAWILF